MESSRIKDHCWDVQFLRKQRQHINTMEPHNKTVAVPLSALCCLVLLAVSAMCISVYSVGEMAALKSRLDEHERRAEFRRKDAVPAVQAQPRDGGAATAGRDAEDIDDAWGSAGLDGQHEVGLIAPRAALWVPWERARVPTAPLPTQHQHGTLDLLRVKASGRQRSESCIGNATLLQTGWVLF